MKLYYHKTDGGAEYYSTKFITTPNGQKEGIPPFILRTDGNEIEILLDAITEQGLKLRIKAGKDVQITRFDE